MVEIRIHGRGGQGGVTLAKLIAASRFLRGASVQAFGLYAAERSGAPVQAFCRTDDAPITNRNLIYEPDHVVVLDPTLLGPELVRGLRPGGFVILNDTRPAEEVGPHFPDHPVAVVDASAIARRHGLGTRSVPIVNTALVGAVARALGHDLDDALAALRHLGLVGANVAAARDAWEAVAIRPASVAPGAPTSARPGPVGRGASFLAGAGGDLPRIHTGQWATEQPRRQQLVPPCHRACPAGNDVQGFLHALAEDHADDALEILLRTSPLPGVCGRVCPAPCMEGCNRRALEGAVDVRGLERLAADRGEVSLVPAERRAQRVAVVGSGPAGLTAAWHLALRGYGLTLMEAEPRLGGLLRTGIPTYRLPEEVLDREVQRILDLGVTARTGTRVDADALLDLARTHDAVLIATGLQALRDLRLDAPVGGVVGQGLDLLHAVRDGRAARLDGEHVVVVGGGNTAIDAARTALRLGAAAVSVAYRRGREEMPAIPEEIEEAIEEGVALRPLTQPVAAHPGEDGRLHLVCRRVALGAPDASGRRAPVELAGSEHALVCDRVLLALGQGADLSLLPPGASMQRGEVLATGVEVPVIAIGDVATGEGTVTAAIGSGRRAALALHRRLSGENEAEGEATRVRADVDRWHDRVAAPADLHLDRIEAQAPAHAAVADAPGRRLGFDEVRAGLPDALEARRCLSCGICNECDLCVTFCPDGVLRRDGHHLHFDADACKGCGICAAECPRGVVVMNPL
jgi:2-oxoacid:acceptor oxidoreductase gamma subunit (pyruvate/2-ketoisovalerate family)